MDEAKGILGRLELTIAERRAAPAATSYVGALNAKGLDAILKKVGEEATEVVIASKSGSREAVVHEVADLWFHCMVVLGWHRIGLEEVLAELARREHRSGIDEKSARGKAGDP
jgi:phosphoribosyl-ATP pyrophosphohydrolase